MNDVPGFVRVWDPFVRMAHWIVVVTFAIAYFTEEDFLTPHVWAGYLLGITVMLRILWGFIGPPHARFSDFLYRPGTVIHYLYELVTRRAARYLGHSPGGGAMVLALWVVLLATVWSGLMVYAIKDHAGPLAGMVAVNQTLEIPILPDPVRMARGKESEAEDEADQGVKGGAEEQWEELHEFFANVALILVLFHIAGVLLASYVHHENLIKAMFTGTKRTQE